MKRYFLFAGASLLCAAMPVHAHEGDGGETNYASDHAPIGVMADHRHEQGEWMLSYRFMGMDMSGNRDGTNAISSDEIASTVPNSNAPPATLRIVPTDMPMQMHMIGGMYGLSDKITLMAMTNFLSSEMDHTTYQGMMGTNILGEFTTESEGLGDTSIGFIYGLDDGRNNHHQINFGLSLSIPTGSIDETATVLSPMNTTPTIRMPYAMQLGSGTYDLKPSVTARDRKGNWSYGAQVAATIRLDENDEGYRLGDVGEVTAWLAYEPQPWISLSGRIKGRTSGEIYGSDGNITAPVQTADPDNYGGSTVEALFGVNLAGSEGWTKGHRIAAEIGLPIYRDLNGPQLETDLSFTLGWQKAF